MSVPAPNIIRVQIPTTNFRKGRAAEISQITFHHIVGDASAAIARFKISGEEASSTYVISSTGQIYQLVDENDTPFTDANGPSNSRSITIEHAGGHPSVPYTAAMYAASAHLVAWIRSRRKITRYERHRNVSDTPTACPGTLDVEGIVSNSSKIMAGQGEDEMITREQYLVGAEAVGTQYGEHFNYDPNRTVDEFVQFLNGQAPVITKAMETAVADGITGVKGIIGWDGYNSQFVGKKVVTTYPKMVAHWVNYKDAMPEAELEEVPGPVYRKKVK